MSASLPASDAGEKIYLQTNHNCIQVQNRLPVLAENVETYVPLKVDVRVVDLLRTLDLWRFMREVVVDGECELERAALVHS